MPTTIMPRNRNILPVAKACLWAGIALGATQAQATDADARALLQAMSTYVASLSGIEAEVDTSLEVVTPEMEIISFTSSSTLRLNRPNEVRLERHGGYSHIDLLFDGKMITLRDRANNAYAQIPAPGSVDELVTGMEQSLGFALPGADLLLKDSFALLMADVIEAKVMGQGVIGGQVCDHLAFRNLDTDWQLWIRTGPQKVPCKMVITSKSVGMAPQYTTHIRRWTSNPRFAAGTFAFKPATGEQQVDLSGIRNLGEAPPPATPAPRP